MSVYKKFTPQDYNVVPFNAHKQYNFNSSSADSNGINYYTASWTPNQIDLYNSGNIKYQQINHLYYKEYKKDNYKDLKYKKTLYDKANILSIPTGLYGSKIKPNSFLLSSSYTKVIDDSYGNLIISGTNLNDYITDPRTTLLNIGPVKGFKKYDLNVYDEYINRVFYKKGQTKVNSIDLYNTPANNYEYDDSYFLNKIYYKNVNFENQYLYTSQSKFPGIKFNGTNSELKITPNPTFNFNPQDDFSIEFWVDVNNINNGEVMNLIGKTSTETIISPNNILSPQDQLTTSRYPFEVYIKKTSDITKLYFAQSDGERTKTIGQVIDIGSPQHIVCRQSSSKMCIFKNSYSTHQIKSLTKPIQNNANIYIGNKGGYTNFFSGSLSQIKIHNKALTNTQVYNHYKQSNGSPYIGNIFYSDGFVVITHPQYQQVLNETGFGIGSMTVDNSDGVINLFTVGGITGSSTTNSIFGISKLQFQGSHLIYENEYKCTIDEFEYNNTLNPTVRTLKTSQNPDLADFTTGSLFKPYITTVGLYNENNELLVVGKLGQPIRTSDETDTTIVLRWDT
jgi:hypothetical protein|tara:strand:+ start:1028 stop:2719 length:1692 start_codon:yes stop_codon:yes gene_type:complete